MSRIRIDPNESISSFDSKSTRIESQEFESFNFDSNRFQFSSNSVKSMSLKIQEEKYEFSLTHEYLQFVIYKLHHYLNIFI